MKCIFDVYTKLSKKTYRLITSALLSEISIDDFLSSKSVRVETRRVRHKCKGKMITAQYCTGFSMRAVDYALALFELCGSRYKKPSLRRE